MRSVTVINRRIGSLFSGGLLPTDRQSQNLRAVTPKHWIKRPTPISAFSSVGGNPQLDPANDVAPSCRLEFPKTFYSAMCSAINSPSSSSLVCTFFSKNRIRFCFSSLEELLLPAAK